MYNERKQSSFLQNTSWIVIMLWAMGAIFIYLMSMSPDELTVYHNGVWQVSTEQIVHIVELVFLLVLGIVSLGLAIVGYIVATCARAQKKLGQRLKEEGVRIVAKATETVSAARNVNGNNLGRLRCSYTDSDGTPHIFKSGLLRSNPVPYLNQNQVIVYHKRGNMNRYFVDVDESAGLGNRLVEL